MYQHFFPAILISFLFILGYFFLCFFVIEHILLGNKIKKSLSNKKIIIFVYEILLGIAISSFAYFILQWEQYNILILLFIPMLYLFAYHFSYRISTGIFINLAIVLGLIYNINKNINLLIVNYILLDLLFLASISFNYIKWKQNYFYISLLLVSYIICIIVSAFTYHIKFNNSHYQLLIKNKPSFLFYGMLLLFSLLLFILFFVVTKFYLKFIYSSREIEYKKSNINDFLIVNNIDNDLMKDFILTNEINKGFILLLDFYNIETTLSKKGYTETHEILKIILKEIKNFLNNETVFYYYYQYKYFFFIKDNEKNEIIKQIKQIIHASNQNKIIRKNGIKSYALFATYGVHSINIKEINNALLEVNKNISYKAINKIVFEVNNINVMQNKWSNFNKNQVLKKAKLFEPNDINIFFKLKSIKNNKKYYESEAICISRAELDKDSLFKLSKDQYVNNIIKCHIAALSIKEFVASNLNKPNNILLIDYPYEILSDEDFDIQQMITKILSFKILKKNIQINIYQPKGIRSNNVFLNNLLKLKENKISYKSHKI